MQTILESIICMFGSLPNVGWYSWMNLPVENLTRRAIEKNKYANLAKLHQV